MTTSTTPKNSATIGFESTLWQAADKLRSSMDAAEYKHIVLGLIFLKYISDTFTAHHAILVAGLGGIWSAPTIGQQVVAQLTSIPWGHNLTLISKCQFYLAYPKGATLSHLLS